MVSRAATRALVFAAVLALVGSVVPPSADAAPNLGAPEVQGGLSFPWDVGFTPDGRMVVTERGGRLSVYASGEPGAPALSHTQIADVWQVGEAGLMGIAVDTSFASNSFIYVCASRTPGGASARNEVLRYVLGADHQLHGGTVILGGMAAANIHDGCAVEMDSAGFLWVTMGDANQPALAQNPNSLNGKVLRINRDGSIPAGNPFGNAVYSIGHRNPQGIAFEPGTGRVFVVEHGPQPSHGDDEINIVWAGGNYGWPCVTGQSRPWPGRPSSCNAAQASSFIGPAWTSGPGVTLATSGGAFLSGAHWDDWNGQFVVSTLKESDLRRFAVTCDGAVIAQETLFNNSWGRLRAAVMAPNGALYLTTSNGGGRDRIVRITASSPTVHRLAGMNRYATAAAISRAGFPSGATDVMVATGTNFPDALAGSAVAGRLGMPVLLTQPNRVPCETRAELDRLNPQRIWVVGGETAVSEAVRFDMAQYAPVGQTHRLSGPDRYATAARISQEFNPTPGVPAAFVATGLGFADALAGAPAAALWNAPLLLVRRDGIPQATRDELDRLNPQRIYILGGPAVIGDAVAVDLQQYAANPIDRLWGPDRYGTAAGVSATFWAPAPASTFVATGRNFPDALAGGAAAGRNRVPLVLVSGGDIPGATDGELRRLHPAHIYVLGGESVVTRSVQQRLDGYTP